MKSLEIDSNLYSFATVLYSLKYSKFIESYNIKHDQKRNQYLVQFQCNELTEDEAIHLIIDKIQYTRLRNEVHSATKVERELIIGRALYRSCIQKE